MNYHLAKKNPTHGKDKVRGVRFNYSSSYSHLWSYRITIKGGLEAQRLRQVSIQDGFIYIYRSKDDRRLSITTADGDLIEAPFKINTTHPIINSLSGRRRLVDTNEDCWGTLCGGTSHLAFLMASMDKKNLICPSGPSPRQPPSRPSPCRRHIAHPPRCGPWRR